MFIEFSKFYLDAIFYTIIKITDYKKKSLSKLKKNESYEEIDTRLASGWYVDALNGNNKKKYKTKEVVYKISKKSEQLYSKSEITLNNYIK